MLNLLRILLKVAMFPVIMVLSFISAILRLLTIISGTLLNMLSMLLAVIFTILLVMGEVHFPSILIGYAICFVFSEFGIFAIAHLILDGVDGLTIRLREI
ncbi:hypothetical protein RFF05_03940 [Bengtsoniella intestinalis]|uniref:hypothetical protein n=1 Tax=Bengtsoniella intestinalis TaxID=3073143 RepID=UPI00391EEB09